VAHAPGRDALHAHEARALGKVVERVLDGHRVDEKWERAGGNAQLAPHPDGGRVDVVGLDVVLEAAARFAHGGDVSHRRARNVVTVRVVALRDPGGISGVAAVAGRRGGPTYRHVERIASLGGAGDAKLRKHGDVFRGGADALDATGHGRVGDGGRRGRDEARCGGCAA